MLNGDTETRTGGEVHSIKDLTLACREAAPRCSEWQVLEDDKVTGSDREIIAWRWSGQAAEVV